MKLHPEMFAEMEDALEEIRQERLYQHGRWLDELKNPPGDTGMTLVQARRHPGHWVMIIETLIERIKKDWYCSSQSENVRLLGPSFIKIAASACAALEFMGLPEEVPHTCSIEDQKKA